MASALKKNTGRSAKKEGCKPWALQKKGRLVQTSVRHNLNRKGATVQHHQDTPPPSHGGFTMNNTKTAFLITLYRILVKGKKHYASPSVDKLIELLSARHDIDIRRRWAFQCLHDIEALGYINRQERFIRDPNGGWLQIPSLISITLKGARKLFNLGVDGAAQLCKEIMGWIRGGDKRWPNNSTHPLPIEKISASGGLVKLGSILDRLKIDQLNPESAQ